MLKNIIHTIVLGSMLVGLFAVEPMQASNAAQAAPEMKLTSPAEFLNPDGSLNLDGKFNGAFDLSGWNVQMTPAYGPVFSPLAADGEWSNVGFGGGPIQGRVKAIAVDGSDVYVGGAFQNVNNIPEADYIARWDGSDWHALGDDGVGNGALSATVTAILVYAPGVIYVGGDFQFPSNHGTPELMARYISRWDGTTWSALGDNGSGGAALNNNVNAITGDGNYLYVGGSFTNAGGVPAADRVARFDVDTEEWVALGSNGLNNGAITSGTVHAIAINDTGVYVGGLFNDVYNNTGSPMTSVDNIAKWNGTVWAGLGDNGAGGASLLGEVNTIAIRGSGITTQVYAGGNFYNVYSGSGTPVADVHYLTYFDGSDWGAVSGWPSPENIVLKIMFVGSEMYVAGLFNDGAGISAADYVMKYDFSAFTWSALGDNGMPGDGSLQDSVWSLGTDGANIYVGGDFARINKGGTSLPAASKFAVWSSVDEWSAIGEQNGALNSAVRAVAVSGTDVYVGGSFSGLNNNGEWLPAAEYIAKWDGSNWSALGSDAAGSGSLLGDVNAIAVHGSDIYVGGYFTNVENGATVLDDADYIAKWDGTDWSAVGSSAALNNTVWAIAFTPNGDMYAGGYFTDADGITAADKIARFDGDNWWALSSNGSDEGSLNGNVYAIATSGTDVYVGGAFTDVNDDGSVYPEADYLAKWNGSAWESLGSNGAGDGALSSGVIELAVSGNIVYAGGNFMNAANIPEADKIAKWNGTTWSALGSNGAGNGALSGAVSALAVLGDQVIVGGNFVNAGSNPAADYLARWNGTTWSAFGSNGAGDGAIVPVSIYEGTYVDALAVSAADLYVGGTFVNVVNNGTPILTADRLAAFGLDSVPPAVSYSQLAGANPSSAASVDFSIRFTEPVTGVDVSDFSLTDVEIAGAVVSGVTGSGDMYVVSVATGTGNGTLRLDVSANGTIQDADTNALAPAYSSGDTYIIAKNATSFKSLAANDGWVRESSETSKKGGSFDVSGTTLWVGDDAGDKQYRSILHFDTKSIPDTAVVLMVELKVKSAGTVGANPFNTHGALLVDVRKPSFGAAPLTVSDFQAGASMLQAGTIGSTKVGGWYSAIMTTVSPFINLSGSTQFRLKFYKDDNDDNGADYLKLYSGNAAASSRPILKVYYYVP